ncbi:MAG: hypothetical protein KDC34_14500 [Saprospiraceae bacterium]|nr:hypothetical protein [Saprospiraceae bacterium]
MTYQTRRRNYKSRRDKLERSGKVIKLISLFGTLFLLIYGWFNRVRIYDWVETYFY